MVKKAFLVVTFKKQLRVDTLSYKTISANKETAHKEWVVAVSCTHLTLPTKSLV